MELQHANKQCENESAGKDGEVVVEADAEAEMNENEVVETFMDAKPEEAVLKVLAEGNKTEIGTVKEPSVEASSAGIKKPQGLRPKTKIVKKVKKLVKKKTLDGTAVQVASEGNVTVEQGIEEGIAVVNIKRDERSAEPGLGESGKAIKNVIESVGKSPQDSSGKDKDLETSLRRDDMEFKKDLEDYAVAPQLADDDGKVAGAEPSGKETLKEVKGKATILKSVGKILQKGKYVKGTLPQGMNKESATILQVSKQGVDLGSVVADKKHIRASPRKNVVKAEKADKGLVEKNEPRKLRPKGKLRNIPTSSLVKTEVDEGTPRLEQTDQDNNNSLDVNEHCNGIEKVNSLDVNTSEGEQEKTFAVKNKQNQLNEDKSGLAENKRLKMKRQGKQVLGSNKKHKKEEVAAAGVTQQKIEERKEKLVDTEKREKDGHRKVKIGGLIFMCNAKTKPDCFRFSVMGVQEKRKDYVMGIKPGIKLFLYDYDLKLLYGVFQSSSVGGMKFERNAFGGSFPAQVRFKVINDCIPLPESQFRKAIKENYNNKNKFKTELTHKQVLKLMKLFRPAPLPAQVTNIQPILVPQDPAGKRSDADRYVPGSSRTHLTHTHERRRNASPPPRREEPPRDLYLSEREYRTYGLRRGEPSQQYPILPPDSSYHRDHVTLDSYRPFVDQDRLLRHAEIERHDRSGEVRLLHLPERDYHPYDHLTYRREILAQHFPDPPASAVSLYSYMRDPHYSYDYRAPERPPRTYLAASSQEDDELCSRYVTAESLAEYYQSSSRRPSMAESVLPPLSVTSRYAYSGSLPYSHC